MNIRITPMVPSVEAATQVAAAGFVQPLTPALREDVDQHLAEGCLIQSFTDETQRVRGFAIYRLFEIAEARLLYLAGIILDPEIQGRRLAAEAVRLAAKELRASHLGLRTQSLRMWQAGERLTEGRWAPHPTRTPSSEEERLGIELSERIHGQGRFPQLPGFYGAPLYGAKPSYHDAVLQAWWDELCVFDAGDAIICIGTLPNL